MEEKEKEQKSWQEIFNECLSGIENVNFKQLLNPKLFEDLKKETSEETTKVIQANIDKISVSPEEESVMIANLIKEKLMGLGYDIWFSDAGQCFIFNGSYWEPIKQPDIKHFLTDSYCKMGVSKYQAQTVSTAKRLFDQAAYSLYSPLPKREKGVSMINALNETLVIRNGKVETKPHEANDFMFYQLPYEYNPDAGCPMFQKFLDEVIPGDIQLVVQEFIGCCLDIGLKLEKAMICVGTGSNGKSVFFEVITYVLGEDNVTNFNINSLCEDKSSTRILIENKLLNYSSDFNGKIWSNGIFKQLVSGEPVEAKRLYSDPEIIRNYARLAFNTNAMLTSSDTSAGFRRRLLPVYFDVKISPDKADPMLAKKLKSEAAGILNWAIEGLKRYVANGYKLSKSTILEAKENEYLEETESVYMFLDQSNYIPSESNKRKLSDLHDEYKKFCEGRDLKVEGKSEFKARMRDFGYPIFEGGKRAIEVGITRNPITKSNPFIVTGGVKDEE